MPSSVKQKALSDWIHEPLPQDTAQWQAWLSAFDVHLASALKGMSVAQLLQEVVRVGAGGNVISTLLLERIHEGIRGVVLPWGTKEGKELNPRECGWTLSAFLNGWSQRVQASYERMEQEYLHVPYAKKTWELGLQEHEEKSELPGAAHYRREQTNTKICAKILKQLQLDPVVMLYAYAYRKEESLIGWLDVLAEMGIDAFARCELPSAHPSVRAPLIIDPLGDLMRSKKQLNVLRYAVRRKYLSGLKVGTSGVKVQQTPVEWIRQCVKNCSGQDANSVQRFARLAYDLQCIGLKEWNRGTIKGKPYAFHVLLLLLEQGLDVGTLQKVRPLGFVWEARALECLPDFLLYDLGRSKNGYELSTVKSGRLKTRVELLAALMEGSGAGRAGAWAPVLGAFLQEGVRLGMPRDLEDALGSLLKSSRWDLEVVKNLTLQAPWDEYPKLRSLCEQDRLERVIPPVEAGERRGLRL